MASNPPSAPSWLPDQLHPSLSETGTASHALLTSVIPHLLDAISEIGKTLRGSHHVSLAGTANSFGDEQLNVDVLAEDVIRAALARCPSVVTASSEEDPVERAVVHVTEKAIEGSLSSSSSPAFTVAFDPLDGSSIIGPNWTVGTIVGIWEGKSALGQNPRDRQIAALLGVYGPRTNAIIALRIPNQKPLCFEVGLSDEGITAAKLIRSSVLLSSPPFKTRHFAPANLRAAADDVKYAALISEFIANKYTLRYSGGLVPDVVHALVKGHGVYISPVTDKSKAKLRRLYELCPVALVVECAGGAAVDPADGEDVLARDIGNCDERGGLVCGNQEEVAAVKHRLLG